MSREANQQARSSCVRCPHAQAVAVRTQRTEWGAVAMILLGVAFLIFGVLVGSVR